MPIRSRENLVGAWAFLIGVVLAVLVGGIAGNKTNPVILLVLAGLGVIVAYFVAAKDAQTFLLASVSLVLVSFAGIQGIVLNAAILSVDIGRFITSVLGTLLVMFVPAAVIVSLKTLFAIAKQ